MRLGIWECSHNLLNFISCALVLLNAVIVNEGLAGEYLTSNASEHATAGYVEKKVEA